MIGYVKLHFIGHKPIVSHFDWAKTYTTSRRHALSGSNSSLHSTAGSNGLELSRLQGQSGCRLPNASSEIYLHYERRQRYVPGACSDQH